MNTEQPTNQAATEARLERSLRRQVKAPRLDGRFDAAVWSRIAEADGLVAHRPAPRVAHGRTPRWLLLSNLFGGIVAVVLVGIYAIRSFSGVDMPDLGVELPASTVEPREMVRIMSSVITTVALGYGLMFTRFGRRLLAQFR